jgi:hypothetical protein
LGQVRRREQRVLFARIGRMHNYAGSTSDDKRPIGGGGYNKSRKGGELYNFKNVGGMLYGYFQPNMRSQTVNLSRVDVDAVGDALDNVLIIFVAPSAGGGQTVVGWYRNARLHREAVQTRAWSKRGPHLASAQAKDCVLIPYERRSFYVPHGKGALGQTNLCYSLEADGTRKPGAWLRDVVRYVNEYEGPNLLVDPEAGAEEEAAEAAERAVARAKGQGFPKNAAQRRAIELHAMRAATRHFEAAGFEVEDVSGTRSYDLVCERGGKELHVEVKGTMTDGQTVILTRNEVDHACDSGNASALFILHSIKVVGKRASGGKPRVFHPWTLRRARLKPISFTYAV